MSLAAREAMTRRIRESVNIVDVVGGYLALRAAGQSFKGLCPFHEEKTPSFTVRPSTQTFKCFGCGAGGDVFDFIQLREKVDFVQARAMLAERAGISLDEEREAGGPSGPGKAELARVNKWAAEVFRRQLLGPAGTAAREYMAHRRMDERLSEAFGLGLAFDSFDALIRAARQAKHPETLLAAAGLVRPGQRGGYYDTFRNRLMFPITDATGRIVGFGGRALGDDPAKYMNTPETALFDKGRGVFGLERAKDAIARKKRMIVVEGYMDCFMAHQYGFDETVASLGTAFTDAQAQLLRRYCDSVVLVFDSDEAGQRAADRALSVSLLQNLDVRVARVPEGKDPCDFLLAAGAEEFARLLIGAPSALEFKWREVVGRFEASETGPARHRAIDEFVGQVATWVNAGAVDVIQRGLVLNQIGKLLSLPAAEVHKRLTAVQGRGRSAVAAATGAQAEPGGAGRASRSDARAAAVREILEVVINEPRFVEQVSDVLAGPSIGDPVLSAIAVEVAAWGREGLENGEWRLDELIGRFGSPAFSRVVTDLHAAGERRANYAATLRGALERLQEWDRLHRAGVAARTAPQARRESDREAEDRALAALHEGARSHRHMAPMSALRRPE